MSLRHRGFSLAISCLAVGVLTSPAYAYLDPGTGSVILQVLLGGAAGLALAGRLYWRRFLEIIGVRRDEPAQVEAKALKSDTPAAH